MTSIMGFDITRFMLRIRTRTTLAVLEDLKNTAPLEKLVDRATNFLSKCLYNEKPFADPLDRADGCLEVARDLLKIETFLSPPSLLRMSIWRWIRL
jgi:hypothetical protein